MRLKALALAAVAAVAITGRAEAAWPGLNGDVFVTGKLSGQSTTDIFRVGYDGTLYNVTAAPGNDSQPSVSPGGTKVLYVGTLNSKYNCGSRTRPVYCTRSWTDLFVLDLPTMTKTRITFDGLHERDPSWSNDGTRALFSRFQDGDYEIFTISTDGTGLTQLTNNTVDDRHPVWGPYLQGWCNLVGYPTCLPEIAFVRTVPSQCYPNYCTLPNTDIMLMETDGSNQRRLTTNIADDVDPNWSPYGMNYYNGVDSQSGPKLTFASNRGGEDFEIFTVGLSGESSIDQLTDNAADDRTPAWSPQGNKVVYAGDMGGGATAVYTLNPRVDYEGIDHEIALLAYTSGGSLSDPDWASYQHP